MADEPSKSGSWWSTLPGLFTAAAAVITAATGLVAILSQTGVLGEKSRAFVSQKASDLRDSMSAPGTLAATGANAPRTDPAAKPPDPTPAVAAAAPIGGAASGIAASPLHAAPFTGAIVTLTIGSIVKLRDDVKEYCQGQPILKTASGQTIEMRRMARFDVIDWKNQSGKVRITLNNGETIDAAIVACAMRGSNDLGDYHGDFGTIRLVAFVR